MRNYLKLTLDMRIKTVFVIMFMLLPLYMSGQSKQDEKEVLEVCLLVPEIQQVIKSTNGIVIMQHGVSFIFDSEIMINDTPVQFLGKSEVNSRGISSFIVFWRFEIRENRSLVEFVYQISNSESLVCEIELIKTADRWNISDKKTERR